MTIGATEALAALSVALLLVLHYLVRKRRLELEARLRQFESLNASLGLRMIRLTEIMISEHSESRGRELAELKESIYDLFRQYRITPPGMTLNAQGDLNIGGDVTGRNKTQNG